MINRYFITWHKNEKYSKPIIRTTEVKSTSAQSALSALTSEMGNLKKITVLSIQEVNSMGEPIGEPIIPMEQTIEKREEKEV